MALSEPLPSRTTEPPAPPRAEPTAPAGEEPPVGAAPDQEGHEVVLDIRDLRTYFFTYDGVVKALDGVTFKIRRGETTGLVGETGCGKSVTAFSVNRLINDPPGRVMSGEILYKGADLLWGLGREARFRSTSQRRTARILNAIDASAARLEAGDATKAAAAELRDAVQKIRPLTIGSGSDAVRQITRMRRACGEVESVAHGDPGVEAVTASIRADCDRLVDSYEQGRVKVRRAFRRIRAGMDRLSAVRGKSIAMIFQEPTQAMNPVFSVGNQLSEVLLLHRGVEVIDEMLAADPDSPEAEAAIDALARAASEGNREQVVTAASALGRAVGLSSFGTQSFYMVRGTGPTTRDLRPEITRALHRRRLHGSQRRYLAHRRRLLELRRRTDALHMEEMDQRESRWGHLRGVQLRDRLERWSHFYYGLWGIRSRVQRQLNEELFWRVVRQLETVSIANPAQIARGFPHELSGGMLQRVMISMALSAEPDILIADEPTTALDVTIQAQILELMRDLKTRVGTAILLITHDLAVIAEVADRVCVMYAGNIVEQGPVRELFRHPLHPYAQGLLASIPRLDQPEKELSSIPGSVPDLIHPPQGCRFHPRCAYAMPICKQSRPPTTQEGPEHTVACYLYKGPVVGD